MLGSHLASELIVVVSQRDELDFPGQGRPPCPSIIAGSHHRVPDVGCAIVLRTTEHTDVDVATSDRGARFRRACQIRACWKRVPRALPMQAGVSSQDHIACEVVAELGEKRSARCRLPQELIGPTRTAVTEQEAETIDFKTNFGRESTQPRAMLVTGVGQCVVIAELREMIVLRIGVAALAIIEPVTDAVIVVPLHDFNLVLANYFASPIGMRAERAEVAEAKHPLCPALLRIRNSRFECDVVVVDAAKECELHGFGHWSLVIGLNAEPLEGFVQIAPN